MPRSVLAKRPRCASSSFAAWFHNRWLRSIQKVQLEVLLVQIDQKIAADRESSLCFICCSRALNLRVCVLPADYAIDMLVENGLLEHLEGRQACELRRTVHADLLSACRGPGGPRSRGLPRCQGLAEEAQEAFEEERVIRLSLQAAFCTLCLARFQSFPAGPRNSLSLSDSHACFFSLLLCS